MARRVEPGRHLCCGPPVHRPRRHPRHRTMRCRRREHGHVAAPRQARWPRPPSRQHPQSRWASRTDLGTTRAIVCAADHGAHHGDLGRAIGLGGDRPSRRIRAAEHHFNAGDAARARTLLESTMEQLQPGLLRGIAMNLMAGIRMYDDTFVDAAAILERALEDAQNNPPLLVQTLMSLAFAQGMAGQFEESLRNARDAVTRAEELGYPPLVSRALAMLVNTTFLYGHGVDEASLLRALALEDPGVDVPIPFCASAV